MIIFPRERISNNLMEGAPPGTLFTGTKFGWINSSIFLTWFKFFVANIPPKRPVLLLYDGHASHVSLELIDYAILHEIIIVCLPAHSSHLLQPLDVAVFKSFKVFFSSACRSFLHNNPGKVITIYNISQLVGEAWPKSLTPENLISGFRHSGIYPLCRAKITPEKLAPSTSTKKKSQKSIDEILAPSDTSKDEISTKKKAPGFVSSGRCITEEEFVREMKEKELEKAAAEQQRKAKREERERRRKEREAEREKKKQTRRRTRRRQQKQVSESEDESSNTEYHCGECGQPYGDDEELWIGCDGDCNGWYHAVCVGIQEGSLPENFYCDQCMN